MYPTLGDLVKSLTGIDLSFLYIFQMFGLMMALAFLSAAYILFKELARKEKQGLLQPIIRSTIVGTPATPFELVLNGLMGFLIGFKVIGIFFNLSIFTANPQAFVFSMQGSWIGGIAIAAFFAYSKYYEKKKQQLSEPKTESIQLYPSQLVSEIVIYAAIFGLIGAKIFDNLENPSFFMEHPIEAMISFSGLTWYGGLILAAAAIIYYCIKNKIPVIHMADAMAPTLILGYAVGRIGCQLAGDGDWGINNTAPKPAALSFLPDWMWAYKFPHNVINEGVEIPNCIGRHCYELPVAVFPTPFYEVLMCLFIFGVLWFLRKRITTAGLLFSIYLILNGIERFSIEQIRVNSQYHFFGISPTQAEIIAVLMVLTGIAGIFWTTNRRKKNQL
ncbi:prolipoprotein diacylglyceryl transferase [Bacteroidota bacterium]|nr:prolipoprotein diacylglyceryl transferase [Bacteroidota bacterium]